MVLPTAVAEKRPVASVVMAAFVTTARFAELKASAAHSQSLQMSTLAVRHLVLSSVFAQTPFVTMQNDEEPLE